MRGLEEPAHASRGLEEPFFQLCCCVSFWFWREMGFGCTYYYVFGVPYGCGVVLVFLVLAGNKKKIQSSVWRVRDHVCLSCRDRYICISSTLIKPNTNPLVQLQYIRYI